MIDLKNSITFIAEDNREYELYIKITSVIDDITADYCESFEDIELKYKAPDQVSERVVYEVLREEGLDSLADLFDSGADVAYNTLLSFMSYILMLKGNRIGYETCLQLLGFQYELQEWWEQSPLGPPNTFSLNIDLNSSEVTAPYETIQKIKKFTADYVFPLIFPLTYTVATDPIVLKAFHVGYAIQTRTGTNEGLADPAGLFAKTGLVIPGYNGNKNIKFSTSGVLTIFDTTENVKNFVIQKPDETFVSLFVDTGDQLVTVEETEILGKVVLPEINIVNFIEDFFNITVDNSNNINIIQF